MARTLLLLRHAKSSWDDPDLDDHDRPLAPRGRRAAAMIAGHLREQRIAPDLILCSSAVRTRETLDLLAAGFDPGRPPRIEVERGLYGAGAGELVERLRRLPEDVGTAMVIGHNPGFRDLVLLLAGDEPAVEERLGKFPTAALASLAVPAWGDLVPGSGRLTAFVKPKELARRG